MSHHLSAVSFSNDSRRCSPAFAAKLPEFFAVEINGELVTREELVEYVKFRAAAHLDPIGFASHK